MRPWRRSCPIGLHRWMSAGTCWNGGPSTIHKGAQAQRASTLSLQMRFAPFASKSESSGQAGPVFQGLLTWISTLVNHSARALVFLCSLARTKIGGQGWGCAGFNRVGTFWVFRKLVICVEFVLCWFMRTDEIVPICFWNLLMHLDSAQ